jgi:hypothetical protein
MNYCFSSLLILNDGDFVNIHPSDHDTVKSAYPSGWQRRCFEHLGEADGYEVLRDGKYTIHVKNAYIEKVNEPAFKVGETVHVNRKQSEGIVEKIQWHIKKSQPIYTISVNGILSGYQYFDDDLAAIV